VVNRGQRVRSVEGYTRAVRVKSLRKFALALQGRRYRGNHGVRVALAQSLVIAEEEPLVLEDGPADVAAELVALEGRQRTPGAVIEKIIRVEVAVTLEVIGYAVIIVAAGLGNHVDDAAGSASEL